MNPIVQMLLIWAVGFALTTLFGFLGGVIVMLLGSILFFLIMKSEEMR